MIDVALIGYGYWGPNLARNFRNNPQTKLRVIADMSEARREAADGLFTDTTITGDWIEAINMKGVDAVAIATPVSSHHQIALAALKAGKHVLVEKPITASVAEAEELIEEAAKRNLVLMVDHTFIYSGPVRAAKKLIDSGELGDIQYCDSSRLNLGLFQNDVDVLWDLAVHDLSIMNYLLDLLPIAVSATGFSHVEGQPQNIGFMSLFYDSSFISHINVNWLAPVKIRQMIIGGTKSMLVYDDLDLAQPIKLYDKGINLSPDPDRIREMLISYRWGDMRAPRIPDSEPLAVEIEHFQNCITTGAQPETDGTMGIEIVRILEAASKSMQLNGSPVDIT
jgi:predicted dehydrogenase